MSKESDHIVMSGKGAKCLHCGVIVELPPMLSIPGFVEWANGVKEDHKDCLPVKLQGGGQWG